MFPIIFLFITALFALILTFQEVEIIQSAGKGAITASSQTSALDLVFALTKSCDCLAESLKLQIPDLKTKAE